MFIYMISSDALHWPARETDFRACSSRVSKIRSSPMWIISKWGKKQRTPIKFTRQWEQTREASSSFTFWSKHQKFWPTSTLDIRNEERRTTFVVHSLHKAQRQFRRPGAGEFLRAPAVIKIVLYLPVEKETRLLYSAKKTHLDANASIPCHCIGFLPRGHV